MKKCLMSLIILCLLCGVCLAGGTTAKTPERLPSTGAADATVTIGAIDGMHAESAILIDLDTGKTLYELNADKVLPPASITKIMTLLLVVEAAERGDLRYDDVVTVSEHACSMGGAQIYLKAGEQMTVEELFKAVSIASANDAAVALAEHVAGSEGMFVVKMNERAAELGMTNTVFRNACGLDADGHVSTARDIAKMSAALCAHEKAFAYSTTWMDSVRGGNFQLVNTNKLIRSYQGITGLKTGSTGKAKCCLSATAKRNDISLCAVVMGCETGGLRFESAAALLDYGFASFERVNLTEVVELPEIRIRYGVSESAQPVFAGNPSVLLARGKKDHLERQINLCESADAPLKAGDTVGSLVVTCDGEEIGSVPIVMQRDMEKLTFGQAFLRLFRNYRLF